MKRFEVEYWIKHKREFWVHDERQIGEILSEQNECKIISITELQTNDSDFTGA